MNRREFIEGAKNAAVAGMVSATGLGVLALMQNRSTYGKQDSLEPPVLRPPGALPEPDFLSQCMRCQRCQDACPTAAIRLASPDDDAPLGTPFIDATNNACTLCLDCTTSCPTEALVPITKKEKVKMGLAVVDERTCVSFNRSGVCGACHTVCPFRGQAITLGLRNTPIVHEEYCVGCGLCEEACILKGVKAIRVFSGREEK